MHSDVLLQASIYRPFSIIKQHWKIELLICSKLTIEYYNDLTNVIGHFMRNNKKFTIYFTLKKKFKNFDNIWKSNKKKYNIIL